MTDSTFARRRSSIWTRLFVGVLFACSLARVSAQIVPGTNVNMVAGQTWPDGVRATFTSVSSPDVNTIVTSANTGSSTIAVDYVRLKP